MISNKPIVPDPDDAMLLNSYNHTIGTPEWYCEHCNYINNNRNLRYCPDCGSNFKEVIR